MAVSTPVVAVELVAASIWVGSLVCLAVVVGAARRVLDTPSQVRLFRSVGRRDGALRRARFRVRRRAAFVSGQLWPVVVWPAEVRHSFLFCLQECSSGAGRFRSRGMSVSSPGWQDH